MVSQLGATNKLQWFNSTTEILPPHQRRPISYEWSYPHSKVHAMNIDRLQKIIIYMRELLC